jgi:thiamine pyrophosphate-dependent acetolactate synthase large subunit-like protein
MARESLNITTVVFANCDYAVLKREFFYLGVGTPGPRAAAMFEIGRPDLNWVALAQGMGVPGGRVSSLDEFAKAPSGNGRGWTDADRSAAVSANSIYSECTVFKSY